MWKTLFVSLPTLPSVFWQVPTQVSGNFPLTEVACLLDRKFPETWVNGLLPQGMYSIMKKFILDSLFPINCLGCGQEGQFICPACFERIPLLKKPLLRFHQTSALTGLIVASDYNHALVKQAIHRYKYDFVKNLAEPLGLLIVKRLKNLSDVFNKNNSVLIPVPLHKKRLRWRGFNQAGLLAEKISQELKIPLADNILIRQRHRPPQMAIKTSQQRKENIKGAFQLNLKFGVNRSRALRAERGRALRTTPFVFDKGCIRKARPLKESLLKNKTIILIDDVCTTGATLEECAQALKSLQPKQIWGLVVARG